MAEEDNEILWGAKAIAKFIGKSTRATFHLLGTGKLPTTKVGRQHVGTKSKLRAALSGAPPASEKGGAK
jgi:hypothetical protein